MYPGVIAALLGRALRGETRHSAFFDAAGEPITTPRVLSLEERSKLAPYCR